MKIRSLLMYLLFYITATFTECFVILAIIWAGFNGFGRVAMEYTEKGKIYTSVLSLVPLLLLLGVLVFRIAKLYKYRKPAKFYMSEILICILGIGVGVIIFMSLGYLDMGPQDEVVRILRNSIRSFGWLRYPMP